MTGAGAAGRPPRLVIASANAGKVGELGRLLGGAGWTVATMRDAGFGDDLDEPELTYAENALAKAATVSTALGVLVLADDSGIEVDALRGWPGPQSARWLGPSATDSGRVEGLLAAVAERCPDDRRARYVCALALVGPAVEPLVAHGECLGEIVAPRGTGGFGYDPIFLSHDLGTTFGEATQEEKDRVSHRGRAVRHLLGAGVLERVAANT